MEKEVVAIVDAPQIVILEHEKAWEVLLKFYHALGWNYEDLLDPSKIRTTKAVYNQLYDLMYERCPDTVSVGMTMVSRGPGTDDAVPQGKVFLLEGWIKPDETQKRDNLDYLEMNLKREHSDEERQSCREIFTALYEVTAKKLVPRRLVYPYDLKTADERMETSYFHKNRDMNRECACAIDEAIRASNYKTNYYNLELAAMVVISKYGFERVSAILAHQIQKHEYDGRYSTANKRWAKDFTLPDKAFQFPDSHAILIDDFATYTRKLYIDLDAARFTLHGHEEHGELVHGYEIIRAIMIDDKQGYVIGHNPDAVSPYVSWQFYIRDGERNYNWGIYGEEQDAVNAYVARVFVAFN